MTTSKDRILGALSLSLLFFACWIEEGESLNFCNKMCVCKDMSPDDYLIDCSKQKLTSHFTEDDWKETFTQNNINTTTPLDVRFDLNSIEKIIRFPPLKIVSLSFRNNQINYIEQSAFADLDALKSVDLSYNNLTSASLPENSFFGRFNGSDNYLPLPWNHLTLSHNNIHSIEKNLFDHLPFLLTMDLSSNPLKILSGSTTMALSQLRNLQVLDLAKTSISSMPEGILHDLIHLETLDLADNNFVKVPESLQYSHNLTVLVLDGNKFETLDQWSFSGLDNLDELRISFIPTLKSIETGTFGPLKKLRILHCKFNRKLNRIFDDAFKGITPDSQHWPVKQMYLNDNGLTVLDKELAAWEHVEVLDIQNNPFKCDCKIEWMAEVLLPLIQSATPEYVSDITCNEPEGLRGREILAMSYEHEEFLRCDMGSQNLLGDRQVQYYPYPAAGIAVLSIGVILIVIGLSILGVIVVKRRAIQNALTHREGFIRYERADTEEEDYRERHRHYQPDNRKV